MAQHDSVKVKGNVVQEHTAPAESDDLDIDLVIACMKEVGHRDSEGYLVLPKYYDE